jgi:hypothetical protein
VPIVTSTHRIRRRLVSAVLAATTVTLGLSGCSWLTSAQTQRPVTVADGVWANTGDLGVRGLQIVSAVDGSGALLGMLVNNGSTGDRLVGVRVGETDVNPAPDIGIPPGGTAQLSQRGPGFEDDPTTLVLAVSDASIKAGGIATVRLTFENNPAVTLQVLVLDHDDTEVPVPTPTPAS